MSILTFHFKQNIKIIIFKKNINTQNKKSYYGSLSHPFKLTKLLLLFRD